MSHQIDVVRVGRAFAQIADRAQWFSQKQLRQHQDQALAALLRHAVRTVPFYRDRLSAVVGADGRLDFDAWDDLPFLSRAEAQENYSELTTQDLPSSHGATVSFSSSGTTGTPLRGLSTAFAALQSLVVQVRGRNWTNVDYKLNRVQLIPEIDAADISFPGLKVPGPWTPPWITGQPSGDWHQLDHVAPHRMQLEWLRERGRFYLWAMPNSGMRLSELVLNGAPKPDVVSIHSFGEVVTPDYRALVREAFGCEVWNTYASEEMGCIACQCPTGSHMHLNEDVLRIEILDEHNKPCKPGQPGELVITSLYNYQMPLIRYRTGDIGIPGQPCSCGRGLATLQSLEGRLREVFYFADGDSFIPGMQGKIPKVFLGAKTYQIAQVAHDTVELRFTSDWSEDQQDRHGFVAAMNERFQRDMICHFRQMDKIPGQDGAKFSYQVCELPPEARPRRPIRALHQQDD